MMPRGPAALLPSDHGTTCRIALELPASIGGPSDTRCASRTTTGSTPAASNEPEQHLWLNDVIVRRSELRDCPVSCARRSRWRGYRRASQANGLSVLIRPR